MKLNQLIAVSQGSKVKLESIIKEAKEVLRAAQLFAGRRKMYDAIDEDGTQYPAEYEKIQQNPQKILDIVFVKFNNTINNIASQDLTNTSAAADVMIGDLVILEAVPAVTLIALAKYLRELAELVRTVPILDNTVDWTWDKVAGRWNSPVIIKNKGKKVQKAVIIEGTLTPEHPAQTHLFTEDIIEGTWSETRQSSAWTLDARNKLIAKIETLHDAVVLARESANMQDVESSSIGSAIVKFLGN